jgi:hypothetical protein
MNSKTGLPLMVPKLLGIVHFFCLFLICLPPVSHASDGTVFVVNFLDAAESIKQVMQQPGKDDAQIDPKIVADRIAAFSAADADELALRMAPVFEQYVVEEDTIAFRTFAKTLAGAMVAKIFKEKKSGPAITQAFKDMPPKEQAEAEEFFKTRAMTQAIAALNSPGAADVGRQYGVDLMCRYYRANDQETFARAAQAGRCPN